MGRIGGRHGTGMRVDIRLLEQQHATIRAAIEELHALTDMPVDRGLPMVVKARLRLAKAVADNVATEIAQIHAPLKTHRLTQHIPEYGATEARSNELRGLFSTHIARWTLPAIRQDWVGYARSMRDITGQLADLIDREDQWLFPTAAALLARIEPTG